MTWTSSQHILDYLSSRYDNFIIANSAKHPLLSLSSLYNMYSVFSVVLSKILSGQKSKINHFLIWAHGNNWYRITTWLMVTSCHLTSRRHNSDRVKHAVPNEPRIFIDRKPYIKYYFYIIRLFGCQVALSLRRTNVIKSYCIDLQLLLWAKPIIKIGYSWILKCKLAIFKVWEDISFS